MLGIRTTNVYVRVYDCAFKEKYSTNYNTDREKRYKQVPWIKE